MGEGGKETPVRLAEFSFTCMSICMSTVLSGVCHCLLIGDTIILKETCKTVEQSSLLNEMFLNKYIWNKSTILMILINQ